MLRPGRQTFPSATVSQEKTVASSQTQTNADEVSATLGSLYTRRIATTADGFGSKIVQDQSLEQHLQYPHQHRLSSEIPDRKSREREVRPWAPPKKSLRSHFDHATSIPLRSKWAVNHNQGHEGVFSRSECASKHKFEISQIQVDDPGLHSKPIPPPRIMQQSFEKKAYSQKTQNILASRIHRQRLGRPANLTMDTIRSLDRIQKLEAVKRLHRTAQSLKEMRTTFKALSPHNPLHLTLQIIRKALRVANPALDDCYIFHTLGQYEQYPCNFGKATILRVHEKMSFALNQQVYGPGSMSFRKIMTKPLLERVSSIAGFEVIQAKTPKVEYMVCIPVRDRHGNVLAYICSPIAQSASKDDIDLTFLEMSHRSVAAHLSMLLQCLRADRETQTEMDTNSYDQLIADGANCRARKNIGANADLWRVSRMLRRVLCERIPNALDTVVLFRDAKRSEAFILLENIPSKGSIYSPDGAVRVVMDDRTDSETDVLLSCAQVRAKLLVGKRNQCSLLKCMRGNCGPVFAGPEMALSPLLEFTMEDLNPEIQECKTLHQTSVPICRYSNKDEAIAVFCVLSDRSLEHQEIKTLNTVAQGVSATLESAYRFFTNGRLRLAASIKLQSSIDTHRDERGAQQALTDMLSGYFSQDREDLHEYLRELSEEFLASETRPRIWLREDCSKLLKDPSVELPHQLDDPKLVTLTEGDNGELKLESRDLDFQFFEPMVLENAVKMIVPLVTKPEGHFLGLIETTSPLVHDMEERKETNLHARETIAAKRWVVHTIHFAKVASEMLRNAITQQHAYRWIAQLCDPCDSIRSRANRLLTDLENEPSDGKVQHGAQAAMRYLLVLCQASLNATVASVFSFDNTINPLFFHNLYSSGLDTSLLVNRDALYLQRRLGTSLTLQAVEAHDARRLRVDKDFDNDPLGAIESNWEGLSPAERDALQIHNYVFPGQHQAHDTLASELQKLRISSYANIGHALLDDSEDEIKSVLSDIGDSLSESSDSSRSASDETDSVDDCSFSAGEPPVDTLLCGLEHQFTQFRPCVSTKVRQAEVDADMIVRQRRYWNAHAGAITQISRFQTPQEEIDLPYWSETLRSLNVGTHSFSEEEVRITESLMAQASLLWHNVWLLDEAQSKCAWEDQIQQTLSYYSRKPQSQTEAENMLLYGARSLREILHCDRLTIHAYSNPTETAPGLIIPVVQLDGNLHAGDTISTHKTRFIIPIHGPDNVAVCLRQIVCLSSSAFHHNDRSKGFTPRSEPSEGGCAYTIWSELCIPIMDIRTDKVVGVLQACNRLPSLRPLPWGLEGAPGKLDILESLEAFTDVDVKQIVQSAILQVLAMQLTSLDPVLHHPKVLSARNSFNPDMAAVCSQQITLSRAKESFLRGALRAKERMERRQHTQNASVRKVPSSRRRSSIIQNLKSTASRQDINGGSDADLSPEELRQRRMAKLQRETADNVVPDARKFVRLAVKRFLEDEALRQDRERQTILQRRKENRDWATMVTDIQNDFRGSQRSGRMGSMRSQRSNLGSFRLSGSISLDQNRGKEASSRDLRSNFRAESFVRQISSPSTDEISK